MGLNLTRKILNAGGSVSYGDYPQVSNEEAAILEQEAGGDVVEADATMGEVENIQDRADNLEETANYVDAQVGGEETPVTQNEVALLAQATDAATIGAGDDVQENIIPAVESYIGQKSKVATEGIREMVKSFWAAIKAAIEKVWTTLKRYYRKFTSRLSSIVKAAKELRETAGKKSSMSAGDTKKITVSATTVDLLSADKKISNGNDIYTNLNELGNAADNSSQNWTQKMVKAGKDLADVLNDVDEDNVADKLNSLNNSINTTIKAAIPAGFSGSSDKRFADTGIDLSVSKQFAGGKALFLRQPKDNPAQEKNPRTAATMVQSYEMTLTDFSDKERTYGETDIDIIQPSQATRLADRVIDICDKLRNYAEGRGFDELQKAEDKVTKAGNKASEKMAKIEDRRSDDNTETAKNQEAVRNLRGIQRYASAWTRWSKNPTMALTNHTCSVMRAAITVGNSSMAKFTKS